ncbi:MAG: ABC transporter ATP-binding protein [Eubacteriales bacterium]|nr:ABC transporter ATP-binding protein [Eubacteriales bacterium]
MAIFECAEIKKHYGSNFALNGFSVKVEPGRIVGLLGPNGSGKTTLMKLANGLLTCDSGEILINGEKPGKNSKMIISYLPDKNYLPNWMNCDKLMDFFADFYADFDRQRAEVMLSGLGLDRKQPIRQMSKGTREKVQLIMVMSRRAKLYLLDEPIGGVDPATRDYILETIIRNYDTDASVIISTHLISDVEKILDDVIFIDKGKNVLFSSVDDIRSQHNRSVDEYFREVFRCSGSY